MFHYLHIILPVIHYFKRRTTLKWMLSFSHLNNTYPKCPHVALQAGFSSIRLRSHVHRSSTHRGPQGIRVLQLRTQAEVAQLHNPTLGKKQITWLDILQYEPARSEYSVQHIPLVKIRQPQQTTTHHLPQLLLIQSIPIPQISFNRSIMQVFHHELLFNQLRHYVPTIHYLSLMHRNISQCT